MKTFYPLILYRKQAIYAWQKKPLIANIIRWKRVVQVDRMALSFSGERNHSTSLFARRQYKRHWIFV
jgi:hypothetical protein